MQRSSIPLFGEPDVFAAASSGDGVTALLVTGDGKSR